MSITVRINQNSLRTFVDASSPESAKEGLDLLKKIAPELLGLANALKIRGRKRAPRRKTQV